MWCVNISCPFQQWRKQDIICRGRHFTTTRYSLSLSLSLFSWKSCWLMQSETWGWRSSHRHGVKLCPTVNCSVEDCSSAFREMDGSDGLKSKVEMVVEWGPGCVLSGFRDLQGLTIPGCNAPLKWSAYADDVVILADSQQDTDVGKRCPVQLSILSQSQLGQKRSSEILRSVFRWSFVCSYWENVLEKVKGGLTRWMWTETKMS